MKWFRLLPVGLVLASMGLVAASPQRDVLPNEARRIAKDRQKDARRQAKRAQRQAEQLQREVARETKRRDSERRRETEQLTKSRREQGKQVEARAGQPQEPVPPPSQVEGPDKDQPSPIERLRSYSDAEAKQQ